MNPVFFLILLQRRFQFRLCGVNAVVVLGVDRQHRSVHIGDLGQGRGRPIEGNGRLDIWVADRQEPGQTAAEAESGNANPVRRLHGKGTVDNQRWRSGLPETGGRKVRAARPGPWPLSAKAPVPPFLESRSTLRGGVPFQGQAAGSNRGSEAASPGFS